MQNKVVENSKYRDGTILLYPRTFLEKYFLENPTQEIQPYNFNNTGTSGPSVVVTTNDIEDDDLPF
jgi:hypothetical protein